MSRIIQGVGRRFTPWKNGGGETAEILCQPKGAGFDDFDWRISTAQVARSGPFSVFPGVDRSLTVIEGGAMQLRFADGRKIVLDRFSGPFAFAGDLACQALLPGPPLLDLNVMVRRPLSACVTIAARHHPPGQPCLACYLFATGPVPQLAAKRHDLVILSQDEAIPPSAPALIIEILGPPPPLSRVQRDPARL